MEDCTLAATQRLGYLTYREVNTIPTPTVSCRHVPLVPTAWLCITHGYSTTPLLLFGSQSFAASTGPAATNDFTPG